MTDQDNLDPILEFAVCPSCVQDNLPFDHFCWNCGRPFNAYASVGPYETILTRGWLYRQAVAKPYCPIILIGMWMIFAPGLICGLVFMIIETMQVYNRSSGWDFWELFIFSLTIPHFAVLYQVTRNYIRLRECNAIESVDVDHEEPPSDQNS